MKASPLLLSILFVLSAPASAASAATAPSSTAPSSTAPASAAPSSTATTLLTHATVIDGTGAAPVADTTLVIADGRILAIRQHDNQPPPKDAKVEDLHGRYVIPGLIDAHVHISDVEPDMAHYRDFMRALLLGGVTGIRDMGGNARQLGFLAQQTATGTMPGPDIAYSALVGGPSFFAKDARVGDAAPGVARGTAPWMRAIDANTDLRQAIAEARGTGASGIKIYANLPADLVAKIAAEAHRQGLRVWTHATIFPAKPGDAVNAGADTISHTPYLVWEAAPTVPDDYGVRARGDFAHIAPDSPALLALFDAMKQHGTILDATLHVFVYVAGVRPQELGAGILPWSYAATRLAHEHGVAIDVGTDSEAFPDGDDGQPDIHVMPLVHAEMALLVEHCGFTPLEAIRAATQVGAVAMGEGDTRGTIAPGKRADLVVLSADPSIDIHNTTKIDFVVKRGIIQRW
ncbi:MAG TPA: amidohydrolase family protein [Xanthomonadaceae bacterium]|jgi:imidazolonepropionase-like amidohydrolase